MGKSLVIVESPAKAKTINKYLGSDFIVKSSIGHIRDLPTSGGAKPVDAKERAKQAAATRKLSPEDKAAYQACVSSGKMKEKVEASVKEAFALGAKGTPYTVLVVGNEQAVINGAQSYDVVKSIIDNLISQLDGQPTAAKRQLAAYHSTKR